MKKYIFYVAAITAISITACRKIETDGEPFIVNSGAGWRWTCNWKNSYTVRPCYKGHNIICDR